MEDLDIIPILVVCETENKAEMLNGLLRGEGLVVHPQWVKSAEQWEKQKTRPELVFYFQDATDPALEEVIAAAHKLAAAVIVVAPKHDPEGAAASIAAGAAAQVSLADTALLAAIAQRERRNSGARSVLQTLEQQLKQTREQLRGLMTGGQKAIAYVQEGVIADSNPSWVQRFGYGSGDALIGLPIMDLFADEDQDTLKTNLRALSRGKSIKTPFTIQGLEADGKTFEVELDVNPVEIDGEKQLQFTIAAPSEAGGGNSAALTQIDALEKEKARLEALLHAQEQREPESKFFWPATFGPIAAERINRPLSGAVRALIAFRPVDIEKIRKTFGPIGISEAGGSLPTLLSPLIEDEDLAVRIDDMTILAVISRGSEEEIQSWAEQVVLTLGEHVFETSTRSSLVGYAAGIAPVDRVRRLEQLTHQALKAAKNERNSVTRAEASAVITKADTDDTGWSALITEALEERRFAVALRPIEDLANADKLYEASSRLLDREGKEILPDGFMGPAIRLDLALPVERRLIGHAFAALLRLLQTSETTRVIVPLSTTIMGDETLADFLIGLVKRTNARLPVKSLIFELALEDALQHVAETEAFSQKMHQLNCGFGLRHYAPGDNAEKLLSRLELEALRLDPKTVAKLASDENLGNRIRSLMAQLDGTECRLIASGVNDANLMGQLYNLGISTLEGSAIGDSEVFNSSNPMFEGILDQE